MIEAPFQLSLAGFEGPLDLLLHLVERERLDITTISLVQVTGQYLAFLRRPERLDHGLLADFVAIGARLIELKSQALLPVAPAPIEAGDEDDPGNLVEMLKQHQRFQLAAVLLRECEERGERAFLRLDPPPEVPALPGLGDLTLKRLQALAQRALTRSLPAPEPVPLRLPQLTVRQKLSELSLMLRLSGRLSVAGVLDRCRSRDEILVYFFAVLELVRRCEAVAVQEAPFGDITLTSPPVEREAAPSAG